MLDLIAPTPPGRPSRSGLEERMRIVPPWLPAATLVALALVHPVPGRAQVLDPIQYQLSPQSKLEYGCFGPCECPVIFTDPIKGDFTFYRTSVDPIWTHYALLNIRWTYTAPDGNGGVRTAHVTGSGTYEIGGEFALTQRLTLDLVTNDTLSQHFDSGYVPPPLAFPLISADAHLDVNSCRDSIFHIVAGPFVAGVNPNAGPRMLGEPRPNPSARTTDLELTAPVAGHARVEVVDLGGRVVAALLDDAVSPGVYPLHWDGRDMHGQDAGSGVFWVRARLGSSEDHERIVRLR
jgi:hypothetical protein